MAFVGPEAGRLASGHIGAGRLAEPLTIVGAAKYELAKQGDLAGRHIVVSAGGTREPIDPVRFISNRSSGKMGYALAEAARDRGARVTLVSTEPAAAALRRRRWWQSRRWRRCGRRCSSACAGADALIMAAAVSDFRPAETADQKMKKGEGGMILRPGQERDLLPRGAGRPSSRWPSRRRPRT